MTRISILPFPTPSGAVEYTAVAGDKRSQGQTAGQALDALRAQLPQDESSAIVIVQEGRPDQFFSAEQIQRLRQLTDLQRATLERGDQLPDAEQVELESLIAAELRASGARAAALAKEIGK